MALLIVTLLAACGAADTNDPDPTTRSQSGASGTGTPDATAISGSPTSSAAASTATSRAASPTTTGIPNPIPEATQRPMPTPRPAIGATVQADGWALTVTSFALFESVGDSTAEGVFLYVRMAISNSGSEAIAFPFAGLVVIDVNGQSYFLDQAATNETLQYDYGILPDQKLNPGDLRNVAAVFDIPTSATGLTLTTPSRVFEVRLEYNEPK